MLDKTEPAKTRREEILDQIKSLNDELREIDAQKSKGTIEYQGKKYNITGFYGRGFFVEEIK